MEPAPSTTDYGALLHQRFEIFHHQVSPAGDGRAGRSVVWDPDLSHCGSGNAPMNFACMPVVYFACLYLQCEGDWLLAFIHVLLFKHQDFSVACTILSKTSNEF